jgi:lysophospholipid acyltransferase (LPLAT)-like uncharacterized protein
MAGLMKIRHPWLIKALGFAGAWIVRLWIRTVRYHHLAMGSSGLPYQSHVRGRYIYAFWHENMLLPAYHCARPDVSVLISQHADGELMTQVCQRLGFRVIRGSTTRGSLEALRQLLRAARRGAHLAITPDGPRGPRRQVQAGVIYLAARTGLPIIAGGVGYQNPWRLRTWDEFVLPKPWRRGIVITAAPIVVPSDLDDVLLEHYRRLVEDSLRIVSQTAEDWAQKGGPLPELSEADLPSTRTAADSQGSVQVR